MQSYDAKTSRKILTVMALVLFGAVGKPQNRTPQPPPQNPLQTDNLPGLGPNLTAGQQEKQAKAQNDQRQKRLVEDTEKLLQLATRLHDDVEKTNKNVLSVDVIKRADEIEKLAHAVKERMRG